MQLVLTAQIRSGHVRACIQGIAERERDRLPIWLPVFAGSGVLLYFWLRFEPPIWAGAVVLLPATAAWIAGQRLAPVRLLLPPVIALSMGFCAGQFATARAPPVETTLPNHAVILTGRIALIEMLPESRRLTLSDVRLDDSPDKLARSIRVRLRAKDNAELISGDLIRVRALVRPPAPPAYPGAWDVQRDAFFTGIGGGGYALAPVERLEANEPDGSTSWAERLREIITARVLAAIPGAAGNIAVTLLTGSARGIPEADHAAFRDSGLAHLLAVAGLHIGIVMGFVMAVTRIALALSERASLFFPTKKLAGLAALVAGGSYMVLTGMHVPIVRSFCMASLVTLALMLGRRPISLRGLALAGVVIAVAEPQEVPGVSFQMSFSAVLALISGYEALRPWLSRLHGKSWPRRVGSHIVALALTSALAGTASMPYGAYHFGHIQLYYVFANMVAVPLTAFWVMPLGMISLPLMPLGLEWLVLPPMGWGIRAILVVAHTTSSWPAATVDVPHIPAWGLAVLSFGLAWLCIWRTAMRLVGLAAIAFGIASPMLARPPDLLVSADARLIAMRTAQGVFIQQNGGGSRFTRDAWVQYWAASDAQPIPKLGESGAGAVECQREACRLRPRADDSVALLIRETGQQQDCAGVAVIVSAEPARRLCRRRPWPKLVDRFTVWRDGAAAIWIDGVHARVLTDRAERGSRPWVPPVPTPRARPAPNLPPAAIDRPGEQSLIPRD